MFHPAYSVWVLRKSVKKKKLMSLRGPFIAVSAADAFFARHTIVLCVCIKKQDGLRLKFGVNVRNVDPVN